MPNGLARTAFLLAAGAALVVPGAAGARKLPPHLSWVHCSGKACTARHTVAPGGYVKIAGRRLGPGMRVIFPAKTRTHTRTVKSQVIGSKRLLARVPLNAKSGRVYVRAKHGVRTNSVGPLRIRKKPKPPRANNPPTHPSDTAFDGSAMWIWELPKAEGGDAHAIAAQAHAHGIDTVFVKSGDGINVWKQFTPQLVSALHAEGLKVCGWQYVYGKSPASEAGVSALAKQNGADCFVIDAEKEYEGRYSQARAYIQALRQAVGDGYPVGMSSFPYVDYHPGLPFSEFFAPGGAQFNVPQVYWKEIGDTVDESLDHTYRYNRPYGVPIVPVGQTYGSPPAADITRFRQIAAAEGSAGVSWWEWSQTKDAGWNALGQELGPFSGTPPTTDFATIGKGAKGDLVVWAQQHLRAAGASIKADGEFGSGTETAVKSFQQARQLGASGQIDTATWKALLVYTPKTAAKPGSAKAAAAGAPRPKSADLPAKRYEIPPPAGR
jgi:hypothetical protein